MNDRRNPHWTHPAAVLAAVFTIGLVLGLSRVFIRPDLVMNETYILDEPGNQLWRAYRIREGAVLYRDLACQYGPLPVYLYAGYTTFFGNTILANVMWHLLGNILCLLLIATLTYRAVGTKLAILGTTFLALPWTLAPGGLRTDVNIEYIVIERATLLLFMLSWRRPEHRGASQSAVLGLLLGAMQLCKFGGAFFLLASLVIVDIGWLIRQSEERIPWARWLKSLAIVCGIFTMIQAAWVMTALLLLPLDIAADVLWPAYMLGSYSGSRPSWAYAGWRSLLAPQLLLLLTVILAGMALLRVAARREYLQSADAAWGCLIGAVFYAAASIAYLGHEQLYYYYAWTLTPAAILGFALLSWKKRVAVLVLPVLSVLVICKITFVNPASTAARIELPNGERIYPQSYSDSAGLIGLLEVSGKIQSVSTDQFILIECPWMGGGFHHFFNRRFSLRNHMFGALSFRPYDRQELASRLNDVSAIVLQGDESVIETFGPMLAKILGDDLSHRVLNTYVVRPDISRNGLVVLVHNEINHKIPVLDASRSIPTQ
jgi:hypothetical protein